MTASWRCTLRLARELARAVPQTARIAPTVRFCPSPAFLLASLGWMIICAPVVSRRQIH